MFYEASSLSANVGGGGPLAALYTSANVQICVREVGWMQTGASTSAQVTLNRIANTPVATTSSTGVPEDPVYASSTAKIQTAWSTVPTITGMPAFRNLSGAMADEAGIVWTWWENPIGLIVPVSAGIVLYTSSGTLNNQGYIWFVWEE